MSVSLPPSTSTSTSLAFEDKDREHNVTIESGDAAKNEHDELHLSLTRDAILAVPGVTPDLEATNTYMVSWDGPDDNTNPLNGSPLRRWGTVALVSLITLVT